MKKKETKQPWPTKDAMEQIYEMNLWGGDTADFYSGIGSHHPAIIQPYIAAVTSFLSSFDSPLTVCDLGCGDFNIGKQLMPYTQKYIAVDIVSDLIAHHKKNYKTKRVEFHCLDIAVDSLPTGDCALVRQVIQHLSNAEVHSIVKKLIDFKYIIVTEHIPQGDFTPNKNIISGQGIRLKKQSGIDLLSPPFNYKPQAVKQLVTTPINNGKEIIATTLYTNY